MIISGFFIGLISSLHCIGMCGPIAMMLPVDHKNQTKRTIQIMVYHAGRITTYTTLGFLFGLFGKGLFIAGIQQQISIVVGIIMLLFIFIPEKTIAKYNFSKPIYRLISKIKQQLGTQFKKKSYDALFSIGLFNGLLPCPMIYVALFGALALQNLLNSVVFMFLFGIGTIPLMSIMVYSSHFITISFRNKIKKIIPISLFIIASLFILRGLNLDIPYISPKIAQLIVQENHECR
jgi:sulfite exporter TauE/SafE